MPVLNGLEAASQLQSMHCRTRIVFFTIHEDKDFAAAAFSAGASGYVVKSRMCSDLVPAIQAVMQGHRYVSQSIPNFL
jgi:DNA-binding NarL/FixJ family response regulator